MSDTTKKHIYRFVTANEDWEYVESMSELKINDLYTVLGSDPAGLAEEDGRNLYLAASKPIPNPDKPGRFMMPRALLMGRIPEGQGAGSNG